MDNYKRRYFTDENAIQRFERLIVSFEITKRQKSILKLLLEGFLYKEIAYKLNISMKTVEFHITAIYKKCHVKNKAELTALFFAPPQET